jgi:hypothetical protein
MNYNVTLQTISWFNGRRGDSTLEISPKFQRRPVWLRKERGSLMDTICSGLPFPEVYIQVVTDAAAGTQRFVVVDGQQRITSILMFIDGLITLPDNDDWDGESIRDLTPVQLEQFWAYTVVVRLLNNTSDAEIRDLFTRLNTNNLALTDQELRNARYQGKFKRTCERLADNPFFQSISLFTAREVRRMVDIEFVSELLLRVVEGLTNKKDLLEEAYAHYDEDFPQESQHEEEFNAAIQLIKSITTPDNAALVKTKSNFYSLFGICLEYYRRSNKNHFEHSTVLAQRVTELLAAARTFDRDAPNPIEPIRDYYDAVSRAASDKGRRARREEILSELLIHVEGAGSSAQVRPARRSRAKKKRKLKRG